MPSASEWTGEAGSAALMVGPLEMPSSTHQEEQTQSLQTQAEMPKGVHILLQGCLSSCLSTPELCFTHTHTEYVRARAAKPGVWCLLKPENTNTHTESSLFPPCNHIFPLLHHLLAAKSHKPSSSGTSLPSSNPAAIGSKAV